MERYTCHSLCAIVSDGFLKCTAGNIPNDTSHVGHTSNAKERHNEMKQNKNRETKVSQIL